MDNNYLKFILAYDYGDKVSRELGLACDEFYELAETVVDKYKERCSNSGEPEHYESFQSFVDELSFAEVWQQIMDEKRGISRTALSNFLEMFDFSYQIYLNNNPQERALRRRLIEDGELSENDWNKPLLGLVDNQGANLGDIEEDRFFLNANLVSAIIERMDIYINDSVINEFEMALRERKVDPSKFNLQEMYLFCKGFGVEDGEVSYTMAELVLHPETIFVPELYSLHIQDPELAEAQSFAVKRENVKPIVTALLNSQYYDGLPSERARLLKLAGEDIYEENLGILIDIFSANGYCVDTRQDNITELRPMFDYQLNDLAFFDVFAEHIEKGTELRLFNDSGEAMRLSFDGQHCHCSAIKQRIDEKISDAVAKLGGNDAPGNNLPGKEVRGIE